MLTTLPNIQITDIISEIIPKKDKKHNKNNGKTISPATRFLKRFLRYFFI